MKKFTVKWREERVINCSAEVYAENAEAAVKKAQDYNVDPSVGEYVEEIECHTSDVMDGKAKEIEDA